MYLFTHTGVQHDCHIRWGLRHFTVTRWMSLVESEPQTLPEHLNSHRLSGICVSQSFVSCVIFVDHGLSFSPFFFWLLYCQCLKFFVYGFWLQFGFFKPLFKLLRKCMIILSDFGIEVNHDPIVYNRINTMLKG